MLYRSNPGFKISGLKRANIGYVHRVCTGMREVAVGNLGKYLSILTKMAACRRHTKTPMSS